MTPFCAICTSEVGPFVERGLGKNGAMVKVCEACRAEHPRQGRYAFGGGRAQSALAPAGDGNKRKSRGAT